MRVDKQRVFFKNLDAFRFLAFLFIFLSHSLHTDSAVVAASPLRNMLDHAVVTLATMGFSLVFVLSGFLNTWVILEEKEQYGSFSPWKYYIRRALRIWPVYFLVLFIGFAVIPFAAHFVGIEYEETANPLYFIFFIGNFFLIEHGWAHSPIITVLWSVSVEEQFYLAWPFLLLLFWKRRIALMLLLTAVFVFTTYWYFDTEVHLWYHPLFLLADILAGALFAFIGFQKNWGYDRLVSIPRWVKTVIYVLFALLVVFYHQIFNQGHLPGALNLVVEKMIITLILGYFIFEQCFGNDRIMELGDFKWITHLGVISYGLYCYHEIALLMVHHSLKFIGLADSIPAQLVAKPLFAFLIVWPMAELSWNFFEKPLLQLKKYFYG